MACRWTFTDTSTATPVVATFEVNPNAGGTPNQKKTVVTQATSAPDGVPLVFEGTDEPSTFEWSGLLTSETQFDMYQTWYEKHHQILLTDDLGRDYWIYITEFSPQRKRSGRFTWKHEYTVKATVLDWA